MKTREIVIVLAIVALLALGGAGIYWYEEQQAASPAGQAAASQALGDTVKQQLTASGVLNSSGAPTSVEAANTENNALLTATENANPDVQGMVTDTTDSAGNTASVLETQYATGSVEYNTGDARRNELDALEGAGISVPPAPGNYASVTQIANYWNAVDALFIQTFGTGGLGPYGGAAPAQSEVDAVNAAANGPTLAQQAQQAANNAVTLADVEQAQSDTNFGAQLGAALGGQTAPSSTRQEQALQTLHDGPKYAS